MTSCRLGGSGKSTLPRYQNKNVFRNKALIACHPKGIFDPIQPADALITLSLYLHSYLQL